MSWQAGGVVRALISFDETTGTPTVGRAFNATLTDDGVGLFTVNFAVAMAADYGVQGSARHNSAAAASMNVVALRRSASAAKSTSACIMAGIYEATPAFEDSPETTVWFTGQDA